MMSEERPKGVIGGWYTLTTDFDGCGKTADRKAGYTWQCSEVDWRDEPRLDGAVLKDNEGYRLATPEEIARAKGEQVAEQPKPSKEAREFWEKAFIAIVQSPRKPTEPIIDLADEAMAAWQKRFEL